MKRPPRPARVFDANGREVLVTLTCPRCHRSRPLKAFGLRRMGDGTIRNAPWCKPCRSGATISPARVVVVQAEVA